MTPDEIQKDRAPERIWAFHAGPMVGYFVGKPEHGTNVAEYVRSDLFDVLTAERDAALTGAVKVKPLVWFKVDTLFHVGEWVAETPGGTLQIIQTKSPPNKFHEVQLGFGDLFDTLEAVQSAAQAKYEACILAALEPNPDDTAALTPADALAAQAARDERMRAEGAKAAEARIERLVENLISAAASLAAAISLLERSGMAVKKAAPSNRMFDQMLIDYRATLESARAALRENGD